MNSSKPSDFPKALFLQYCQDGLFNQASQIIKEYAQHFISRSEHSTLAVYLSRLPNEFIEKDPMLLTIWGAVFATEKNYIAEQSLLQAKSIFFAHNNTEGCALADIELSYVLYLRSPSLHALSLLEKIDLSDLPLLFKAKHSHYINPMILDVLSHILPQCCTNHLLSTVHQSKASSCF